MMNLKTLSAIIATASLVACSSSTENENGFVLSGKFSNANGQTVILEQMTPQGLVGIDTVVIDENGELKIHSTALEKGFYRLKISDKNFATFIFDADEKVTVGGNAEDLGNTYTVDGSVDSKLFWEINQASMSNYKKRDSLQKVFQAFINVIKMDSVRIDSMSNALEKPYMDLVNEHNQYLKNFVEKNPSSFASLAAIQQLPAEEFIETYIKLDDGLFSKYPNSTYIKTFHEAVQNQKKLGVGTLAPEITMNNTDEKPISLSSLKGKVVLVDFWASWCGPCRAENPTVVKAYNKFKAKGFEIFSVSLDKDMDKWKEAIKKDNLVWTNHVCDFKFWDSPVVSLYNFNAIPYNVLIDKEGNILAKNLRGEDLEKKLQEVLN